MAFAPAFKEKKMKAKILRVTKQVSKYKGYFWYVFFLGANGQHYKTCIDPKMKNSRRWFQEINLDTKDLWLDNLIVKKGDLINADSCFVVLRNEGTEVEQEKLFDTDK